MSDKKMITLLGVATFLIAIASQPRVSSSQDKPKRAEQKEEFAKVTHKVSLKAYNNVLLDSIRALSKKIDSGKNSIKDKVDKLQSTQATLIKQTEKIDSTIKKNNKDGE